MPWARFEDRFPIHRKVSPLDDATYRLHTEAIFWCARETTDGRISRMDLPSVSTRARAARVRVLVDRGLWHEAGFECPSDKCPDPGADGWVIHDYLEYQPTRDKVKADLAARAERTRKWREAKGKKPGDAKGDASPPSHGEDTSPDSDASPTPPRPAPKEAGAGPPKRQPAASGGVAAAGVEADDPRAHVQCPTCGNALSSTYHRRVCVPSQRSVA